jgi:hypothetical protein
VDAWLVVQVMTAEVEVIDEAVTAVMVGAGAAVVANVKFVDVADVPALLAEITA